MKTVPSNLPGPRTPGLRSIYDLPIGYWRTAKPIFNEERELQPEWACTLTSLNESYAKLARTGLED